MEVNMLEVDRWARCAAIIACLAIFGSCGVSHGEVEEDEYVAMPPGKADNYLSPVMQEYDITGKVSFALKVPEPAPAPTPPPGTPQDPPPDTPPDTPPDSPPDSPPDPPADPPAPPAPTPEELMQQAEVEVQRLTKRVTSALEAKLYELYPKDDRHDDGAVIVMVREASTVADALAEGDDGELRYVFTYRAEAAGTLKMLPFADGSRTLRLELGGGSGGDPQSVELAFEASTSVKDTYPRYRELLKDGLDIYIQYGGDYNEKRWDLRKSKALFGKLVKLGFKAPVATYDDLKLDSGPFVGNLDVGGTTKAVRVKVVHPDMVPDEELDKLIEAYKHNAKQADVVVYSGHASEDTGYSGIVVHYKPRKALPATKFRELDLPDRHQIFVFAGCYTYTGYADELLLNPKKSVDNTDIITAVSSTPLSRDIVHALLQGLMHKKQETWFPRTWLGLLETINKESEASWRGGFGVHGLQGNPTISPLADPATVGTNCSRSSDCPGIDNLCVRPFIFDNKVCGAACTDSADCPAKTRCWWSFSLSAKPSRQCVPVK
jgi:hypothetical protein